MPRTRDDRGTAAVEFAVVFTVVLALMVLLAPLAWILTTQLRLDRVAAHAARFATQTLDNPSYLPMGSQTAGRRPTCAEVVTEATYTYTNNGSTPPSDFSVQCSPNLPVLPDTPVTITISETLDLGAFGGILDTVGVLSSHSITLSASATAIEE